VIIPTDGGLRPGDAKWEPMQDWLCGRPLSGETR
jgi:hypothetical protein